MPPSDSASEPEQVSLTIPEVVPGMQGVRVEPVLVTSADQLASALPGIVASPILGLDTETTGLDPLTSRVRLVQLAGPGGVWVVDLARVDGRLLQPVIDRTRRIAGHNLKFDLAALWATGLVMPADLGARLVDTMLCARLVGAGDYDLRYGLAEVAARSVGVVLDKTEQVSDWSGDLRSDQIVYAARDAAVLPALARELGARIREASLERVAAIEHRVLPALVWMEHVGAPFEAEPWLRLAESADRRRRLLEERLDALAPWTQLQLPIDGVGEDPSSRWSSPDQVLGLLAGRGLVLPDTRETTLREHLDDDPLVPLLLQHRESAKLGNAYGRDFISHVHPATGRIHADYFQIGADSGRMACHGPNLQQVPRDAAYRSCFRAPEGRVLVKADFSQVELRIAAELTGDEGLLQAYRRGADIHTLTARSVLGRAQVTAADRQAAKACAFGLLYGMGAAGLERYARGTYGVRMSPAEARLYRERFFQAYPGVRRWHMQQPAGPIATRTLAGRRLLHVEAFTEKLNAPVQGSCADGLKTALGLLWERQGSLPGAVPVITVHDEILVEADAADGERAAAWIREAMVDGMASLVRWVPIEVEVGVGPDWSMAG
ncbi:MAG TPA: DNA polymerase [Candidatus Dormibacteraeota bacterium]|jgi:DNA polymerase-1|nr:DNA polymerase [Candidatus Dormibacteraeota bacterium]